MNSKALSPQLLKSRYLNHDTPGLRIFKARIKNEQSLAQAVDKHNKLYERAINVCLPAALDVSDQANDIIEQVGAYLGTANDIPVSIIFAANNTGGTANAGGIALALEVICQQAETPEQAREVILSYIAHETVHVFQYRLSKRKDFNFTLLELSLIEGAADFIANEATGHGDILEMDRSHYGKLHEARLWAEFSPVMNQMKYAPWMYSVPEDGRPNDLGYWVGKQIAAAYVRQSQNKASALHKLLVLEDAVEIVEESGYNPKQLK
ncbi:hypothetical protein SG34_012860 [Thalassomonas viridans]|uniref:DUF2268 domain-containing protein n=1 Tax=Thalassomonas viridans TaxID=137584 RepID=A0AAE9Z6J2_9GAMM|nr:DUF2268 domain-containing putative Zn-dependent protease [Thalassomonas viridans]WDE07701.1 hypothetical protein SG34_012860 [Thalassomonas viridans]